MYLVLLKFSANKKQASEFMEGHKEWIKQGLDEGVFLLVGSMQGTNASDMQGGSVLAHNCDLQELQDRVNSDPFVKEDVVQAEIIIISPNQTDERLSFILN